MTIDERFHHWTRMCCRRQAEFTIETFFRNSCHAADLFMNSEVQSATFIKSMDDVDRAAYAQNESTWQQFCE